MGSVSDLPRVDPADAAVGARLRRWRAERDLAAEVLARALDISPETLRLAEAGRAHLTSAQIAAATACLRLPLWALVSDTPAY